MAGKGREYIPEKGLPRGKRLAKGTLIFLVCAVQAQVVCGVRADQRRTAVLGMVKKHRPGFCYVPEPRTALPLFIYAVIP